MNLHMDVSLQCLQFVWYVSGSRRRFCVAVTPVAVYSGLNFESVNTVKTVERSNRPICFSGLHSFFSGLRSGLPRLCNAGVSPDVTQRSNCQGMPRDRRGSTRLMNSHGIVSESKHEHRIVRRAAPVHRVHRSASIEAY